MSVRFSDEHDTWAEGFKAELCAMVDEFEARVGADGGVGIGFYLQLIGIVRSDPGFATQEGVSFPPDVINDPPSNALMRKLIIEGAHSATKTLVAASAGGDGA